MIVLHASVLSTAPCPQYRTHCAERELTVLFFWCVAIRALHSLLLGVHDRARPPDAAITSKPRYNQVYTHHVSMLQ